MPAEVGKEQIVEALTSSLEPPMKSLKTIVEWSVGQHVDEVVQLDSRLSADQVYFGRRHSRGR